MTISAFVTLVVLAMIAAYVFIFLAGLPGKTARRRGHPNADAINVLGWVGLPLGAIPWLVALVWSHMQPIQVTLAAKNDSAAIANAGTQDDSQDS